MQCASLILQENSNNIIFTAFWQSRAQIIDHMSQSLTSFLMMMMIIVILFVYFHVFVCDCDCCCCCLWWWKYWWWWWWCLLLWLFVFVIVAATAVRDNKNIDDGDYCDHFCFCLLLWLLLLLLWQWLMMKIKRKSDEAKDYLLNEKQFFTSIAITSPTIGTKLHISTMEWTVLLKYLVVKSTSWFLVDAREQNLIPRVTRELALCNCKGDIRGFKCKLSNTSQHTHTHTHTHTWQSATNSLVTLGLGFSFLPCAWLILRPNCFKAVASW